ncbi:MAG: DNA repair protein RecO [Xanthomonadaceae bacterium]|nr:DNA repair protein RecO [Xanthomonadaceae bacterium]
MVKQFDRGIPLKVIAYEDRHKIVTALTENYGLVSAMAKNSVQSKRFGSALGLFVASKMGFTQTENGEWGHLSEAEVQKTFSGISGDFEKLSYGSFLNEIFLKIAQPGVPAPELFKLYVNALHELDQAKTPEIVLAVVCIVLTKILGWSGHKPNFKTCMACDQSIQGILGAKVTLDFNRVCWVCPECSDPIGLTGSPLFVFEMDFASAQPIKNSLVIIKSDLESLKSGFHFLLRSLCYHLPGLDVNQLQSLRFIQ